MRIIAILFTVCTYVDVMAMVKITDISLKKIDGDKALIELKFDNELNTTPEILIKDNIVQVTLPGTSVWPKIEKQTNLLNNNRMDSTVTAYQFDKNIVRARAILPFSLVGKENQGQLIQKARGVEVTFPLQMHNSSNKNFAKYDEAYLDQLLKNKSETSSQITDQVKNTKSSIAKKDAGEHDLESLGQVTAPKVSYLGYFAKFITFLVLVLGIFYTIVWFFKRGVLKKGKFGFLNSTNIITVLSTSYLAPKQSLILVKVYEQIFLLGSSEKGLSFLSEIKDVVGLIKSGEKQISGNNFDSVLMENENEEKAFRLKENINNSQEDLGISDLANAIVKDKVKFSEQIKKKMKKLKQLQ